MRSYIRLSSLLVIGLTVAAIPDDVEFSVEAEDGHLSLVDKGYYCEAQVEGYVTIDENGMGYGPGIIMTASAGPESYVFVDESNGGLRIDVGWYSAVFISDEGKVGIGTFAPSEELEVAGDIEATGKVIADSIRVQKVYINNWSIDAPDYVFDESYPLASLEHVESYIKENKHLPDVPSGKQIKEDGIDLAEMNMVLLRKIEELTLYTLAQQKEIEELKAAVKTQHANRN